MASTCPWAAVSIRLERRRASEVKMISRGQAAVNQTASVRRVNSRTIRCLDEDIGQEHQCKQQLQRRQLLSGVPASLAAAMAFSAAICRTERADATPSFAAPPAGFRLVVDRFDGYSVYVPESWVEVRGAGQDCFFRSPTTLDENISVEISSPSSSRYLDISDLGSPEEAGQKLLKQFLNEFMSTRLGVRRESALLRTDLRPTYDGEDYYEVEVNVKSYANNNQLAVLPEDRPVSLEWDRRYVTVLAVANRRLYQLRAQVPERLVDADLPKLRQILNSFQVFEVLSV